MPNCITCNFVYLSITTGINIQLKDSRKLQLDDLPYTYKQFFTVSSMALIKILNEYRCKEIIKKLSVLSSVSV